MPVEAESKFCPKCQSPAVEFSTLVGGSASCSRCHWQGTTTDLLTTVFQHDLGSNEQVLDVFGTEFRNTLARSAGVPLAQLFLKWGLLSSENPEKQRKELSRFLNAMSNGAVKAVLEERAAIAKEPS